MKLHVIDIGWGISRQPGVGRVENEVENRCFEDLTVGPLPPIGPLKHVFVIEEVGEDFIVIALSEKAGKKTLKVGEAYEHHPLSMDGGHYYRLELE
ncbi:MAG: hypothetical protein IJS37_06410 [Bacilli bacterium]|nr:hypothetical protein [Bacilli bacterium]